jgi:AcrR family transcriptional regulator
MAKKIVKMVKEADSTTEEKIKNAARAVFHRKGFAATRTRDIAEEAEINLALLNYYFRSKEKLFDIIMLETMGKFMASMTNVFNDESSSLEQKITSISSGYIDLLLVEPEIPLFILNELRGGNADKLFLKLNTKEIVMNSVFAKQYQQAIKKGKIRKLPILHFLMNLIGLTVFPFVASPILKMMGDLSDAQFKSLLAERKKLIPLWMAAILKPE